MIAGLWLGILGVATGASCMAQPAMTTLFANGPLSNRFNIVVLSEGYTAGQLPRFLNDATNALDALMSREPYREYRGYFNAFAIAVASAQSGSDHPAYGIARDTYFNSSYDALSDYLITIPPNAFDSRYADGQGKVDALLASFVPECHLSILLVNDRQPGGSDGFDRTAIAALGFSASSMADVLAHETGHVVAGLGDEYTNAYPSFPNTEEANTTRETRPDYIKWRAWFDSATPIPTPPSAEYASVIGLFQGAHYHAANWYRPKLDCLMNHASGGLPFCEVCREALVLSFYRRVKPVDVYVPASTNLLISSPEPLPFVVGVLQPASHNLNVQWTIDGVPGPGATNRAFTLVSQGMSNGLHTVTATVRDETTMVRNDSLNFLNQEIIWHLAMNVPQLRLDSPMMAGNKFVFRVTSTAPEGCEIQRSSNLVDWETVFTNTLLSGECWVTNVPERAADIGCFFRARAINGNTPVR